MSTLQSLHDLLERPARERGAHAAIIDRDGQVLSYAELARLSSRVRDRLRALGVDRGDRVGLYLRKSADAVSAIFGILRSGAAYVPVDPLAPAVRNAYVHGNCGVKAVFVERRFLAAYRDELAKLGPLPVLIVLEDIGGGQALSAALEALEASAPAPATLDAECRPTDLAYILYTSGSTGKPKGVVLSHENATSFVRWCEQTFAPLPSDVFSSHAPLHFDLSIFDLYVPLTAGATLALVSEEVGKEPQGLAALIADRKISVWYSAPSTLSLLAQFGNLPARDLSALRMILFAGEVFPIVHLRSLAQQLPAPRYFNLYGPTETNVCTYYEVPSEIPADRTEPYPIGKVCSNLQGKVIDTEGQLVAPGAEGELCIAGPHVMQGYFGQEELTRAAFLPEADGQRWYKTGDIVIEAPDGNLRYVGRRDRMVKKRGYRIELGEIEACLYQHPAVREVAVLALSDDAGVKVLAHLSVRGEKRPSLIELKTFCSRLVPLYMVPDAFVFHAQLPKTSTDKIDYQALKGQS